MRLPNRLRTFLGRPDALRWTVVLAVVLCLPSLATGWILDDRMQHTMVNSWESFPALIRAPHDLYAFILDDPAWQWWVRERGTLPWYASEGVHASFWRPLTSWTVYLDHAVSWSSPVLAHVHSLIGTQHAFSWWDGCFGRSSVQGGSRPSPRSSSPSTRHTRCPWRG